MEVEYEGKDLADGEGFAGRDALETTVTEKLQPALFVDHDRGGAWTRKYRHHSLLSSRNNPNISEHERGVFDELIISLLFNSGPVSFTLGHVPNPRPPISAKSFQPIKGLRDPGIEIGPKSRREVSDSVASRQGFRLLTALAR